MNENKNRFIPLLEMKLITHKENYPLIIYSKHIKLICKCGRGIILPAKLYSNYKNIGIYKCAKCNAYLKITHNYNSISSSRIQPYATFIELDLDMEENNENI